MDRFIGKKVVITGAASGIGRATALAFAEEGAVLGLVDVDAKRLADVCDEIGVQAKSCALSLSGEESARRAIQELALPTIDVLVNNAGIDLQANIAQSSEEAVDQILAINFKAPFFLCKHALPLMPRGSAIVNVASGAGLVPITGRPAYNSSKGALIALSRSLALDLAPDVRVNCVCPGGIDTQLLRGSLNADDSSALNAVIARYPLKRLGEAKEIARSILFLASEEATFITGSVLAVDGGRTLH